MMRADKRKKLKAQGWKIGDAKEFLSLSEQEAAYIELKLILAQTLRAWRIKRHMGQTQLAELVESSQSRVAKMEAADGSVSLDRIFRTLFALGASGRQLGRIIIKSQDQVAV